MRVVSEEFDGINEQVKRVETPALPLLVGQASVPAKKCRLLHYELK